MATLNSHHSSVLSPNTRFSTSLSLRLSSIRKMKITSSSSYQKFVDFAIEETKLHTTLLPSPLQEKHSPMKALDGKTELHMQSFQTSKVRLLRSMNIVGDESVQVLDFAAFPKPEFDLPIFCANFFSASTTNIIVLDLNPLYDITIEKEYKDKYYKTLMPLGQKYAKLLPWGGKLTSESLRFFSPIVLWTKFTSSTDASTILYSAFMDYYKAWLELMDCATEETDVSRVICHRDAQHKYLTWRVQKDPGQQFLKKLIGETSSKELLTRFLFDGVNQLGSKTFLDYFPEYRCENGTVNEKRSMVGKSFENRPWDARGEFIGNTV